MLENAEDSDDDDDMIYEDYDADNDPESGDWYTDQHNEKVKLKSHYHTAMVIMGRGHWWAYASEKQVNAAIIPDKIGDNIFEFHRVYA